MTVKNKLAVVIPSLHPGGAERQLYYLIKYWGKNRPLLFYFRDGSWSLKFKKLGADLIHIDIAENKIRYLGMYINIVKYAYRMRKLLKYYNINILYTWLFEANAAGVLSTVGLKTKNVTSIRFGYNHYISANIRLGKIIEYIAYILIFNSSYKIISNSNAGANILKRDFKTSKKKIYIINNGFPNLDYLSQNKTSAYKKIVKNHTIGFVGRLDPIKDPFLAIDSVSRFAANSKTPVILYILGKEDGISRRELMQYAEKKQVTLYATGHIDNVQEYYKCFDVLLSTSTGEGCSNVIIEALACGIPVVATNVGDNQLLLDDKRGRVIKIKKPQYIAQEIKNSIYSTNDYNDARVQYVKRKFNMMKMVRETKKVLK